MSRYSIFSNYTTSTIYSQRNPRSNSKETQPGAHTQLRFSRRKRPSGSKVIIGNVPLERSGNTRSRAPCYPGEKSPGLRQKGGGRLTLALTPSAWIYCRSLPCLCLFHGQLRGTCSPRLPPASVTHEQERERANFPNIARRPSCVRAREDLRLGY